MAAKKKKGSSGFGQLLLNLGKNDERIPKLFGILCLFFAFYLLIAFSSYLITWKVDQDLVLHSSWTRIWSDEYEMANWLGRLGAVISNFFFYWGFGLPSFIFVFLFFQIGMGRIRRQSWREQSELIWNAILMLLFLSILLAFVFRESEFPWGGAFGSQVTEWLIRFVGIIGTVALLVFVVMGFVVWVFNPNLHDLTYGKLIYKTKVLIRDLSGGRLFKRPGPVPISILEEEENNNVPLRPKGLAKLDKPDRGTINPFEIVDPTASSDVQAPTESSGQQEQTKDGQLAFELPGKEKREKLEALKPGSNDLEISETIEEKKVELEDAEQTDFPATANTDLSRMTQNQDLGEPYDPTLELSTYEYPVTSLLVDYDTDKFEIDRAELERNKDQIVETLLNYKIEITKIKATVGPTVTLYEIVPAAGVRISKIKNLEDDIALSLAALGIRIIAPIPGKGTIGIEVPNQNKAIVSLKELLLTEKFKRAKMDLPIALGKTISNEVFVADLAKMPHLLVAGATGQGKSVGINVILMSLLYKKHPSQIKFVLIDPKKVELFPYSAIENHFLAYLPGLDEPIVTDTTKVVHTLNSLTIEMDNRYNLLKKAQARNITEYNKKFVARKLNPEKGHQFMPFIVLVVDEFADLIMTAGKEIEHPIGRLAQLSRAVGIHLIIATQRPSVNIITGVIKANFPARIAFRVTSKVDSRTILDSGGADQLIGRGDMLLSFGSDLIRLQCAFVDTPEVESVIDFIAKQPGYPEPYFLPEFHGDDEIGAGATAFKLSELDDMFEDAARLVVSNQHGSTSMIQRRLKLGYNRAGRIMDQLEALGMVGPSEGSKAREVLIYDEIELERYLEDIKNRK